MGLAGGLYATFYAYHQPAGRGRATLTFQIWAMLIVGGAGNNRGAILGAYPDLVRVDGQRLGAFARIAPADMQLYTGTIQFILIGSIIVGMLLWRPQGLLPEKLVISQSGKRTKPVESTTTVTRTETSDREKRRCP